MTATSIDERYFSENTAQANLGSSSARMAVVMIATRIASLALQFIATVALARILSPTDFGLVAVVAALTVFAPVLVDLGTADATAQKQTITRSEVSSLFWLTVLFGAVLTLLFAASSVLIAKIYGIPELFEISLAWSLAFVGSALPVQHIALMRRAMQFKHIALLDIITNITCAIIAVGAALAGWGFWALVIRALLAIALSSAGAWIMCPWRPGRPHFNASTWSMVRFGLPIVGFGVLDNTARASDRLALGYVVGPTTLGFFQYAQVLYTSALSPLTEPMHALAISSFSKMRADPAQLKLAWAKALAILSFWSAPAFAIYSVTAIDLVALLLGEKWAPTGVLLSIIALRGVVHVVERTHGWLHVVLGHTGRWALWGVISSVAQLVALAIGLPFGAIGVAITYTVFTFVITVPAVMYSGRDLNITVRDVLDAIGPQVGSALLAALVGFLARAQLVDVSHLAKLFISIFVVGMTYLFLTVVIMGVREPLLISFSLVSGFTKRFQKQSP